MSRFFAVSLLLLAFFAGGAARAESVAPAQATLAVPELSCSLCTAAEVTGLVTFGAAYAPMLVELVYLEVTFLPVTFVAALVLGPLALVIPALPLLVLLPVVGPLIARDVAESDAMRTALLADAAVQGVGLAMSGLGYWAAQKWHMPVAVAPLVGGHSTGVMAGLRF